MNIKMVHAGLEGLSRNIKMLLAVLNGTRGSVNLTQLEVIDHLPMNIIILQHNLEPARVHPDS